MTRILGRKHHSSNADWLYAVEHIEELISPEEVQEYAPELQGEERGLRVVRRQGQHRPRPSAPAGGDYHGMVRLL